MTATTRTGGVALSVALGALVLAGCGGSGAPSSTASAPTTVHLTAFTAPDGNIGCAMGPRLVRCDIAQPSWRPPPRPPNCELSWGNAIEISGSGPAHFVCSGYSSIGGAPELAEGASSVIDPYRCRSAGSTITCTDAESGHAFSVSRGAYSLHP